MINFGSTNLNYQSSKIDKTNFLSYSNKTNPQDLQNLSSTIPESSPKSKKRVLAAVSVLGL